MASQEKINRIGKTKPILLNIDQTKECDFRLFLWRFRNEGESQSPIKKELKGDNNFLKQIRQNWLLFSIKYIRSAQF